MKIYDCFAFFNELDLLELRLTELWEVVDHFVLVEATRTFQRKPKPLFYFENKNRFEKFQSKIIHIVVDEYPTFWSKFRPLNKWDYDVHQKNQIMKGLRDASPDDLVIVSDLDEIPLAEKVFEYRRAPGVRVFEQYQSYYFLNYVCTRINDYGKQAVAQQNRDGFGRWRGSVMLEKKHIQDIEKTRLLRDQEFPGLTVIRDGGWHFSNMGGIDKIIYKLQSWAHTEYNSDRFISQEKILKKIKEGQDLIEEGMAFELVDIQKSKLPFPKALVRDLNRWSHMIRSRYELDCEVQSLLERLGGQA